ncbi:serine/threonine protein kinase [Loktanella agnita]|uniref:serine/threonine protein kinase n=1 Tax=Loktanella agnita TaxID=287097 RepID=UPI003986B80D
MGKAQIKDNADDKDGFVDELKPGTKLMHGQYTIESFLNAGGFGITYLAKDSLDRKIVIKECFPGAFCRRSRYVVQARSRAHQNELKSIVRLFVQEARSLAKLDHPNIVGVHQVFEDNDTAYMALDFVEGRDLLDTIEDPNHGLVPAQIRTILKEVLSAVGFIHDQGILHRDISPDNILINQDFHPVLIDFGAAREEATKQSRVLSALRVVKDGYSPQEFYIAGSEQSPSSDLYALGATFFHLIDGDVPPNSQARLAAIASGDKDPYNPLAGRFPEYDDNFLAAIDKSLAVLPKDRLQSARAWLDAMDGNAGNVTALNVVNPAADTAVPAGAAETAPAQKSKMPLLLGTAAVLAIVAGVGVMMMGGGEDAAPVAEVQTPPAVTTPTVIASEVAQLPVTEPEVAPAPVIVDEAAPEIVEEPSTPTPVIVEAPASEAQPTPDVRPSSRPNSVELAAAPEPLPEPLDTPRPEVTEPEASVAFPDQANGRPAADTETAEVALPDTPDDVSAVGIGPDVEIAAVTPGNEVVPPSTGVESSWSVQLPFAPAGPDSPVIGDIGDVAPVWVQTGLMIMSVNGVAISAIDQIPGVLREQSNAGAEAPTLEVTFGTLNPVSGDLLNRDWIVPVVQETTLLNGVRFETVFAGNNWRTTVAEAPASLAGVLEEGDVLVSYISTGEEISGRQTLRDIFERELENGTELFTFAVLRGESTWASQLRYTGSDD